RFRQDPGHRQEPAVAVDLRVDGPADGIGRRSKARRQPRRGVMSSGQTRIEHDLLGDREVPSAAYYGVHTLRAVENFPITGNAISIYPDLIRALACIKQAAAIVNSELGLLDAGIKDVIVR